jgi:hypothetical protein
MQTTNEEFASVKVLFCNWDEISRSRAWLNCGPITKARKTMSISDKDDSMERNQDYCGMFS